MGLFVLKALWIHLFLAKWITFCYSDLDFWSKTMVVQNVICLPKNGYINSPAHIYIDHMDVKGPVLLFSLNKGFH